MPKNEETLLVSSYPDPVYDISRQIRYGYTLKNTSGALIKQAKFWTYAPVKQTAVQHCVHLEISHPYKLILDPLGNQILYFVFEDLPPFANTILTIKADLMLADTPNLVKVENEDLYLKPEKYIEIHDTGIAGLAKKINSSNKTRTAETVFNWVASRIVYSGFSGKDRGALYALNHRKGDCTEFMYLFVALSRACKIPARCIGGYTCTQNSILKPSGYHNWAEFYENGSWQIADPQKKIFMKHPSHYIVMRILGDTTGNSMGNCHQFRFEGEGLGVRMND